MLLPLFILRPGAHPQPTSGRRSGSGRCWCRAHGRRRGRAPGWDAAFLLFTGFGMLVAGLTIVPSATFVVFVPQDLAYLGLDRAALDAIDPRLVPLIAHDRAGFGGGLATAGLTVLAAVWCGTPQPALWEALLIAGRPGSAPRSASTG